MAKKERVVVEGEIVDEGSLESSRAYRQYTQRPTDSSLVWVWTLGIFAVFFSFIPIFGLLVCVIALAISLIKKVPPVLPIVGIVIGSITTSLFLLLWLILKAIF